MTESEEDNLTILSSWAPEAYHCFATEFCELEQLKQQQDVTDNQAQRELEAKCRAEVDLQIQRDYPDVYPLLSEICSTPWSATAATSSTASAVPASSVGDTVAKRQKNKQAQQQLQAEVAMVTAKREFLLQQHMQAALSAQDCQPARQLATRYSNLLTTTQKQVKAYLEREVHELQRFTSRPLASYALGEVLEVPPAPPKTASIAKLLTSSPSSMSKRSGATSPVKRDGAAGAFSSNRAASERGSNRSLRTKKSVGCFSTRSGKVAAGTRSRMESLGVRKPDIIVESGEKSDLGTSGAAAAAVPAAGTRPPPFLIDAHQFAVEYNEMLKREYGYRPAMSNTFPTAVDDSNAARVGDGKGCVREAASAAATAEAEVSLREMLRSRVPGQTSKQAIKSDAGAAGGSYNVTGWLPLIHAMSQRQGLTTAGSLLSSPRNALVSGAQNEEETDDGKTQRFAHSSPTLHRPEKLTNTSHLDGRNHSANRNRRVTNGGVPVKPSAAKTATKISGSASTASNALSGIDCVAKDKGLYFSTYVGETARQTVRFVNRNAYRTRLRLKASTHPWLTYRCIPVAPGPRSPAAASNSSGTALPETPLSCGGFVEVEVIFCPDSIEVATAAVDAVLEMGVARELNDRRSEGAQWQFMRIAIKAQVLLPRFEWWRQSGVKEEIKGKVVSGSDTGTDILILSDEGVQSTDSVEVLESGNLLAHDVLPSYATPLHVNSGAAVEFGDVLILGCAQQILLLENTGSAAVINVLSSSPEFSISLEPEVATVLRPFQAVVLHVTFCPLKQGLCEATLTVAVRASDDAGSAVLSEHTVILRGGGVMPRVSIVSLASQVVAAQEGAPPQWQVHKSEAPLLTILKDTMPGVPAKVVVTVRNDCAVPLAFHWEGDSDFPPSENSNSGSDETEEKDGANAPPAPAAGTDVRVATLAAKSFISPSTGVLPPFTTSAFTLTIIPATLQSLQTLYNLFLDEMPDPSAAENSDKVSFVDAEVLDFYQRTRPIPCTVLQQQSEAPLSSADGCKSSSHRNSSDTASPPRFDALQVTYLDPITAFSRFQRTAEYRKSDLADKLSFNGVFATSFLTYQQPSLPSLTITPAVLEERLECLLECRHTGTVTLHNNAPVALQFVLDPTEAEFVASLRQPSFLSNLYGPCSDTAPVLTPTTSTFERWRSSFPVSDGIAVQCQPRKGTIPAHGTVRVTVHFTVEACGPHYAVVPCWIPAAEQLRALLATAGPAVRTASVSRRPSLSTRPASSRGRQQHPLSSGADGGGGSAAALSGLMPSSRRRPMSPSTAHLSPEDAPLGSCRLSERRALTGSAAVSVANAVTALSRSPAEDALRIIEEGGCYAINVAAIGVGATVKVSTELLDFGFIELGQEAAASFTVSNPNAVPVVFDLCDPLMRHPPRFVFIPESFRLGAGNTVEVTVYRKAVSTEDAQTFFELTVRDGGAAVAVETRATIQQPLLVVDAPVVEFGVVPEGVWQTGTFRVSNRSAIDTEFTVVPATPLPPYIAIEYEKNCMLRAGEQLDVPVRCRFQAVQAPSFSCVQDNSTGTERAFSPPKPKGTSGGDRYSILLGLVSKRSRQTLLVEVRCDAVEKLSVSVDVVAESPLEDGAAAAPLMSTTAYIRALLMNAFEAALSTHEHNEAELTHADTAAALTDRLSGAVERGAKTFSFIPYCSPVHLVDYMPDDLPLSRRTVDVVLQSYTGGEAMFTVKAQRYAPQPMECTGAKRILEAKETSVGQGAKMSSAGKVKCSSYDEGEKHDDNNRNAFSATLLDTTAKNDTAITLPAFWATTVNGKTTVQQAQRQIVEAAQRVLGDGSGCVTLLTSAAGVLRSHGTVRIPVDLWCALPGRYLEHLCVQGDPTLPLLRIPIEYQVYGKPIVLDATTSGLTKDGGREGEDVLLMPPVIAPLGSSRRTIRLINRVSRDMDVSVEVFPCPLGMAVHAVDPDAPADKVELKLLTMTSDDKEREGGRVGRVTAAPVKLCIPAHARREVVLEFTPNDSLSEIDADNYKDFDSAAKAPKRGSNTATTTTTVDRDDGSGSDADEEAMLPPTEKWWQGSVCINAVFAQSESNDIFLIDEFYTLNADRYPSQRVARPLSGTQAGPKAAHADKGGSSGGDNTSNSNNASSGLSVSQVKVLRPLRTRPFGRVVRRGRIVWPTEAEQRVLDRYRANQAAGAAASAPPTDSDESASGSAKSGAAKGTEKKNIASSDDGDDSVIDASSFTPPSQARGGDDNTVATTVVPSLEVLLREAEERQSLLDFIQLRRRMLQTEGDKYFSSIELRLRARCGRPHLTIEPSERCVEFPAVPRTEQQQTSAIAAATLSVVRCTRTVRLTNRNSAPLRFTLSFTTPRGENDSQTSSVHLFSIVKCALWQTGHDKARDVFVCVGREEQNSSDDIGGSEAGSGTQFYTLDSMDALDVTIEAQTRGAVWSQYLSRQAHHQNELFSDAQRFKDAVEGLLKVQFLPTSAVSVATTKKNLPAQLLPLRVPLTKPLLQCRPGVVWFRPGQGRHDGRQQVAYTQTFTLYNAGAASARFRIHPVAPNTPDIFHGTAMDSFRAQQQDQVLHSFMSASVSSTVAHQLVTANTTTTTVGAAGAHVNHSLTHKVKEVINMPATAPPAEGCVGLVYVDDPSHFTISPSTGVLPPASLGGEPSEVRVRVDFREFSGIRYESLFAIVVDDDSSVLPTYVVVRGDSRDTEL